MYINFINRVVIDTNAIYCINSYRDGQVHIIKYGSDIEFKNIDPLEFEMLLNKYNRDLIIGDNAIFLRLASGNDNSVLFHMKEIDYAYLCWWKCAKKYLCRKYSCKKVYCGEKLVWSKEEVKGPFGKTTHTYTFGNNGRGNQYYIYFEIYISSKNYINNKMSITVDTYLGSIGNYDISASTPRTGTVYVNGTSRTTQEYNATCAAGKKKRIGNNGWGNHVTPGSTVKIKASIPLHVTINDGVGKITTVNVPEFSYSVLSM